MLSENSAARHSTAPERIVGKIVSYRSNRHIDVPLRIVWFATFNNATLSTDTIRRSLHIRLESLLEQPEEQATFAIRTYFGTSSKSGPDSLWLLSMCRATMPPATPAKSYTVGEFRGVVRSCAFGCRLGWST